MNKVVKFQRNQKHEHPKYIETPIVIKNVSEWPLLRLPEKFSEENWADMIRMLEAMKKGLIFPSEAPSTD